MVRGSDVIGTLVPYPLHQRRLITAKGAVIGAGGSGGAGGSSRKDQHSGAFWDEVRASSSGLVVSSPEELEPMLSPPSNLLKHVTTEDTLPVTEAVVIDPVEGSSSAESPPSAAVAAGGEEEGGGGGGRGEAKAGSMSELPNPKSSSGVGGFCSGNDDQLWVVYDCASAAGKGVMSKVNAPDPYWLGRASPGAVCPHAHSMEFDSCFEGANLLRAVQVRAYLRAH